MPDYKAAIKKVREEQPDQSETSIEPAGFFGRLLGGNAQATASPWTGNVSYNQQAMQGMSQPETENILAHELTHSRQIQQTPYWQRPLNVMRSMISDDPYYERPREMEAFQTERDRNLRYRYDQPDPVTARRDIELPISPRRKVISMFTNDRQSR